MKSLLLISAFLSISAFANYSQVKERFLNSHNADVSIFEEGRALNCEIYYPENEDAVSGVELTYKFKMEDGERILLEEDFRNMYYLSSDDDKIKAIEYSSYKVANNGMVFGRYNRSHDFIKIMKQNDADIIIEISKRALPTNETNKSSLGNLVSSYIVCPVL